MPKHNVLWLTERGDRHQQMALQAAPPELNVTICRAPSPETLRKLLSKTEFLISERRGIVNREMIQQAPYLKLVVRLGSLIDDIDTIALKNADIHLSRQPILMTMLVAEHGLMVILALVKRLPIAQQKLMIISQQNLPTYRTDEDTFSYNWSAMSSVQGLYGKRITIIGMGEIGVELARRLQPFHPKAIFYMKRRQYPPKVEQELGLTFADDLDVTLAQTDILVNLLPYSADTELFINQILIEQLPTGAYFVHLGSGSTVDESAIANALVSEKLGGAALDTFEYEPLPSNNPLIVLAQNPDMNLILTPHIAASTLSLNRADDYGEIIRFLHGQPRQHEINLG